MEIIKTKKTIKEIPLLDFKKLKHRRSNSDGISRNDNIDLSDLLKTNRQTTEVIKEIRVDLDMIRKYLVINFNISSELKEIKKCVTVFDVPESPKTLSKCDAIVGNTQSIIRILIRVEETLNQVSKYNTEHYISLMSLIISLNRDVDRLQRDIDKIKKKMDL